MDQDADNIPHFLIARGGPFFDAQKRLGLITDDSLRPGLRALILVALTWGVPLILTAAAGTAFGPLETRPYLLDPSVWARSLIAIALLIVAEGRIETGLRICVRQFFAIPMLASRSLAPARAAISKALARRDSALAELLCAILAIAASFFILRNTQNETASSWAISVVDGEMSLTAAAWWSIAVSNTIFWFLLLRALWRHVIWGLLLARLTHLDLRLAAAHPDKNGGLGFVGNYPNAYISFTFATSCVFAATIMHQRLHGTVTVSGFAVATGIWLATVYVYFGAPLVAAARLLTKFKAASLLAVSRKATEFQRQEERKTLGANIAPDAEEPVATEVNADPAKLYEATKKLSPLIVTHSTLLPVTVTAMLPLAAFGATQLPFKEMMPILKRLLLL